MPTVIYMDVPPEPHPELGGLEEAAAKVTGYPYVALSKEFKKGWWLWKSRHVTTSLYRCIGHCQYIQVLHVTNMSQARAYLTGILDAADIISYNDRIRDRLYNFDESSGLHTRIRRDDI